MADKYATETQKILSGHDHAIPMPAPDFLSAAHDAIYGDRERSYGNPQGSFDQIADYWTIYIRRALSLYMEAHGMIPEELVTCFQLDGADVAQMMIHLKQSRGQNGRADDDFVDIAGYAGCIGRLKYGY